MPSRIIPLEDLKKRSVMFWLPPGGRHNDVWADTWVIIAELEPADAAPILARMNDADVGAYIARQSARKGLPKNGVQLYVDREQYNKAIDVVMLFLRRKDQPAMPVRSVKAPRAAQAEAKVRPRPVRILFMAIKIAFVGALLALGMLLAYYRGPALFPAVHRAPHPAPISNAPGIVNSPS